MIELDRHSASSHAGFTFEIFETRQAWVSALKKNASARHEGLYWAGPSLKGKSEALS